MKPRPEAHARALRTLEDMGVVLPDAPVRLGWYGDSPEMSSELIELIRSGQKRAGTSLLWQHEAEGEPLPSVGDLEVVLDFYDVPQLVTQVLSVVVLPFNDVSNEYAAIEGEGDGSLEYWRSAHWAFFSQRCEQLGRVADESMQVVCSTFSVLCLVPTIAD